MRYRLIPGPGCPQALCDQLNAALSTPSARRAYHTARCTYRPRDNGPDALPFGVLAEALEGASLSLREAMLLPVRFDMTARPAT